MKFLYFLEDIRFPFLDSLMSVITNLGGELVFMVAAIAIFWCINKKLGYYMLTAGFAGTVINQFLKLFFRIPRPWVKDPDFTIVESARAEATGYSFPSGHTQNITTTFGSCGRWTKNKILKILFTVGIILVSFSRMYLGVHTPLDVGISLLIGAGLVFLLYPVFESMDEHPERIYLTICVLIACTLGHILYAELYNFPADTDIENLTHGIENGYKILGAGLGLLLVFHVDRKYLNFATDAPAAFQILKGVLGLVGVLIIQKVLKAPLLSLFGGHNAANAVRYLLMVLFAGIVWPLTFPWFSNRCPMSAKTKKILKICAVVFLCLAILVAILLWIVTRESSMAPKESEGLSNPLITSLGTTMLSAHRSGGGIAPENTMMAFQNCVESDEFEVDIFEMDLHLTADGVLVLLHDPTLDRTSNSREVFGEENVAPSSKTFEELKQLNMGEAFVAEDGSMPFKGLSGDEIPDNLRIMSLNEILEYLEGNGEYKYIIEIKDSGETGKNAADILYDTLTEMGCLDRTVVGTFHNEVTAYIDSEYPDMYRSAGVNEVIKFYLCALLDLDRDEDDFDFVALQIPTTDYVVNLGTSRVVNYAHEHNIAVQYWTINNMDEIKRLRDIGADAIMTDVPDQAYEFIGLK